MTSIIIDKRYAVLRTPGTADSLRGGPDIPGGAR